MSFNISFGSTTCLGFDHKKEKISKTDHEAGFMADFIYMYNVPILDFEYHFGL
jgi:hypothetical protein